MAFLQLQRPHRRHRESEDDDLLDEEGSEVNAVAAENLQKLYVVDALRERISNLRGVPDSARVVISFDQSRYIRAAVQALKQ